MKKRTKILSVVLALMLTISAFAVISVAASAAETTENVTDENLTLVGFELNNEEVFYTNFPCYNGGDFLSYDDSSPQFTLYFSDGSSDEALYNAAEGGLYLYDRECYYSFDYDYTINADGYIDTVTFIVNGVYGSAINVPVPDSEPDDVYIDYIDLVKAPDKTEYIKDIDYLTLEGLEYNIHFTDGTVTHIISGIEGTAGLLNSMTQYFTAAGEEVEDFCELPLGENIVRVSYYNYYEDSDTFEFGEIVEYKINVVEDTFPSTIASIEIIKLPDKVFTDECPINGEPDNYGEKFWDLCYENGIYYNMNGAKMEITFTDGTTDVYDFYTEEGWYPVFAYQGRNIRINDLGGYKAEVEFAGKTTEFEAKHSSAEPTNPNADGENPTVAPDLENTKPTVAPDADSESANYSTADTATNDSVTSADNNVIATGSSVACGVGMIILLSAGIAAALIYRRRIMY